MKLPSLLQLVLIAWVAVVARAQDEEQQQEQQQQPAADCAAICDERSAALIRERDELWHSRDAVIREKDELWHSREAVIREKDELWHSRENIIREKDDLLVQQQERALHEAGSVQQLQDKEAELALKTKEMAHYQKVAQDNQKYMQEYKDQLATQRDRSNKLSIALTEAQQKIDDLESTTFLAKLQKEIAAGWGTFVKYWHNVKGKGEKEL